MDDIRVNPPISKMAALMPKISAVIPDSMAPKA
jgi:hypothetical protein